MGIWKSQISERKRVRRERWLHCDKIPSRPVENELWLWLHLIKNVDEDGQKSFVKKMRPPSDVRVKHETVVF